MKYKVHTLVETLTLYTAAYCYRSHDIDGAYVDKDAGLKMLSVAIVSNKTIHERNTAFSYNIKLSEIVRLYTKPKESLFLELWLHYPVPFQIYFSFYDLPK